MLRYPFTKVEAEILRNRLLDDQDQEIRSVFFQMDPVQDMVDELLGSSRLPKTHPTYQKKKIGTEQKIYEIVCYVLENAAVDKEVSGVQKDIRIDEHFWEDAHTVVGAMIKNWDSSEEIESIIQDYKTGKQDKLVKIVEDVCSNRLYHILSSSDKASISLMTNIVLGKLTDKGYFDTLRRPGAFRHYLRLMTKSLFLKYDECHLTEGFPNEVNPKKVGYAYLTLRINETQLINILQETNWYEYFIQDPFCDSVEREYEPYSSNPSYKNVAAKNRVIERDIDNVLLDLKNSRGMCKDFPAKKPEVKYGCTWDRHKYITTVYSEALEELLVNHKQGEMVPDGEDEREESEVETLARTSDNYYAFEFRTNRVEEQDTIDRFNSLIRSVLPEEWQRQLIWRSTYNGENSISIGRDFLRDKIFSKENIDTYSVKNTTGLTAEEIFDKKIEAKVNAEKSHLLRPFEKIIDKLKGSFNDEDYNILMRYLQRLNS